MGDAISGIEEEEPGVLRRVVIRKVENLFEAERRDQKPLMVIKEGGAEVGSKLIIWKEER